MQTLAKYLFGLLLILFASLTNKEPVKEEIVEKCSQLNSNPIYACDLNENTVCYI